MGKNEFNSANRKLDNAMKSKGLQKLRWYCQICEKQCRDENGFKCHTMTEGHLRQMLVVGENAGKHISDYSSRFQAEFVGLLSRRWGTKRIRINQVYQEYISDKAHLHMNATRWLSLTEFCKHLGRTGVAHVDETEKGWFISWIDNSPKALARSEASQKKERSDMDDESRQRKLIQEQIERARREGERRRVEAAGGVWMGERDDAGPSGSGSGSGGEEGAEKEEEVSRELKRDEGEKVSLSLSFKTKPPNAVEPIVESASSSLTDPTPSNTAEASTSSAALPSTSTATISSTGFIPLPQSKPTTTSFSAKPNVFKSNPLKRPNPLKGGSSSSSSTSTNKRPAQAMSAVESIFQEEMARKNRQGGGNGDGGYKRGRYD